MENAATEIRIPLSSFFCVPFVRTQVFARIFWGGRDVTPEIDHAANRRACAMANEKNSETAKRLGVRPPYYHYDAISGRAFHTPATSPDA